MFLVTVGVTSCERVCDELALWLVHVGVHGYARVLL